MRNDTHGAQPYFDMELFLATAETTRLDGTTLDMCLERWRTWSNWLQIRTVTVNGGTFLAAWLEEDVEREVDAAWNTSPSEGFILNALAQTLCMCLVHERIPEIEEAGCAPLPRPSVALVEALVDAGLPAAADAALRFGRKYAVVTPAPFGGGCEICALQETCPRSGANGDAAFTLPGHE